MEVIAASNVVIDFLEVLTVVRGPAVSLGRFAGVLTTGPAIPNLTRSDVGVRAATSQICSLSLLHIQLLSM